MDSFPQPPGQKASRGSHVARGLIKLIIVTWTLATTFISFTFMKILFYAETRLRQEAHDELKRVKSVNLMAIFHVLFFTVTCSSL